MGTQPCAAVTPGKSCVVDMKNLLPHVDVVTARLVDFAKKKSHLSKFIRSIKGVTKIIT